MEEFQDFLREGVDSAPEVDSRLALLRLKSATFPKKSGHFPQLCIWQSFSAVGFFARVDFLESDSQVTWHRDFAN